MTANNKTYSKGTYIFTGLFCAVVAFLMLFCALSMGGFLFWLGFVFFSIGSFANLSNANTKGVSRSKKNNYLAEAKESFPYETNPTARIILSGYIQSLELPGQIAQEEKVLEKLNRKPDKNADKIAEHEQNLNSLREQLANAPYDADAAASDDRLSDYRAMYHAFSEMRTSDSIWMRKDDMLHTRVAGGVSEGVFDFIKCENPAPIIKCGMQYLYIYPEVAILATSPVDFTVLTYSDISISSGFEIYYDNITDVAFDGRKERESWDHMNKDGSPDRRYSYNRHYYVMRYGQMTVTIKGTPYTFIISNQAKLNDFVKAFNIMCGRHSKSVSEMNHDELIEYAKSLTGQTPKLDNNASRLKMPINKDPLFDDAARFVVNSNHGSTSAIQRQFSIGYNRSGIIMDQLEQAGIVGPIQGAKPRQVLVTLSELETFLKSVKNNDTAIKPITKQPSQPKTPVKGDALKELASLIGLDSVKSEVENIYNLIKIQKIREQKGLKSTNISYHCVFTGNPGTGKTTVARLVAQIYKDLGILSKGHLVETDRSGLVAEYVGQTAVKTNKIVDSALDGVLFIDEAYSLVQGGSNDFGLEAIATLLKRMEDDRDRLVVILAGYSTEMKQFIDANPGLQSRFNRYIHFEDYDANDLVKIFNLYLKKYDYHLTDEAASKLQTVLNAAVAGKDKNFGNARFVRNLFEKTIENQAQRLASVNDLAEDHLTEIQSFDIPRG